MTPRRSAICNEVQCQRAPFSSTRIGDAVVPLADPPLCDGSSPCVCGVDGGITSPKQNDSRLTVSPDASPPESPSFSRESVPDSSTPHRIVMELREQLRTSIPALVGMILYKIPWLISLGFVGRIGPMELAAAALASALCDVTGMSLSYGLSSAITTFTGQARGELLAMAVASKKDAEFKQRVLNQVQSSEVWRCQGDRKLSCLDENERKDNGDDEENGWDLGPEGIQNRKLSEGKSIAATGNIDGGEGLALSPPKDEIEEWPVIVLRQADYGAVTFDDDHGDNENWRMVNTSMRESNLFGSYQSSASVDSDSEAPLLPMVYLYRGIFIQLCLVIPVGIWWLKGVYPLLIALGQPDDLSVMTETYLRILTPGLWSYSINWTLTAWLQAIEMADVPPWAALVGGLLHVPFNLFFIRICGWGWLGVGAATVMFQVVQPTMMFLYLFCTKRGHDRLLEQLGAKGIGRTELSFGAELYAAVSSPWGIYQYLELAIPGLLVVSEWWASEVAIFLSGRLQPNPEFALSAMAIYQSINSACFMLPVGVSVGGSTRVGNLLGANDPSGAGLASGVCIGAAATLSCVAACFLYLVPHSYLPSLFSTDEEVIRETSSTITLLSVYVFADGIQVALNGIIKGCGKQCITVPIVLTAYWLVGLPLAYYFSFVKHEGIMCQESYFCGIVGLVGGMTAGTWVHFILLFITIIFTINWEKEAKNAQDRLALESKKRDSMEVGNAKRIRFEGLANFNMKHNIRTLHQRSHFRLRKDDDISISSIKSM